MRSFTASLLLLLAAQAGPALAQAAPAPAQPAALQGKASIAVSRATAASLARVVAPAELMIPVELDQARKAILALPTLDEDAKQLEQKYPGLYAALWQSVEPEMRRSTEESYPGFWAVLEQLYVDRLTEQEAQAVMTFFKSATGQKLLRGMYGNVDAQPMLAEIAKSDSATIDEKQMKAMTDAAKAKALQQLGPGDEADLWILATSIDLEKFRAIGAETQKVTLQWVNKEDAAGEEKLTAIMKDAMEKYMAAHPPKK